MYAQPAAEDRFSFNQIVSSDFIRSAMRDKRLIAHSSPTTIHSKVDEYFESAKVSATEELKKYKSNGKRFELI